MTKTRERISEIRSLSGKKILDKINESKKRLIELEQDKLLGKLKNTAEIRLLRKQIARYFTVLDEQISRSIKEENA